eukprot:Ihof_evm2s494 gene=Ihof_evmTU2s494
MYMANKRWQEAYDTVREWAGDQGMSMDQLPADLRVKLGLALVRLGQPHDAESHFDVLAGVRVADHADLFMEIIDTYMACQLHDCALPLLHRLVAVDEFKTAAVWARKGECEQSLGLLESAVESLAQVQLAKDTVVSKGADVEASSTGLNAQETAESQLKASASYTRAMLLLQLEKYEAFLDVGLSMVSWFLREYHQSKKRRRIESFLRLRHKKRKEEVTEDGDKINAGDMALNEWVDLVLETCKVLVLQKRPQEARDILEVVASDRKRFQYKVEVVTTIRVMMY